MDAHAADFAKEYKDVVMQIINFKKYPPTKQGDEDVYVYLVSDSLNTFPGMLMVTDLQKQYCTKIQKGYLLRTDLKIKVFSLYNPFNLNSLVSNQTRYR